MLRTFLSVSVFLLTLAACLWATVTVSRGPIERDLSTRALEALEGIEGFRDDLCEITFEGRDGRVVAEVKSEEIKSQVEDRLASLYGVRVVVPELVVRPYDAPWIMVGRTAGGQIHVGGLLAQDEERQSLVSTLEKALGGAGKVDQEIDVRDKVESAAWLSSMGGVAGNLVLLAEDGHAELRDGSLSLRGEMPSADAEEEFVSMAEQRFDGRGIDLEFGLTVAPPPEPSYFEMSPPANGEIIVSGRLADLKSAQELLSLLRTSGDWIIKDQIVVEENTTPAPWVEGLTYLLPSMLGEVLEAGVKIEGSELRLEGQLESEGMYVAIGEVASQNFPAPQFKVQNRLRVVVPPREAMVSVITYPGGHVELKGLLADVELKERIIQAIEGAMEGGELRTDALRVEANVMGAEWIDALVGLMPPYIQQVERGGLTIYLDSLVVEAVIESDAERNAIWAMTEHWFPDDSYQRVLELRFPEEVEEEEEIEGKIAIDEEFQNPN